MNSHETEDSQQRRRRDRAEALLRAEDPDALAPSLEETPKLLHELRTHQIELEMQNEELRRAQKELLESRDKYSDLYDFAPVGYFTLDENGVILETNMAGAELLAVERRNLIGSGFSRFVSPDSTDVFYIHRRQVAEAGTRQSCGLQLIGKDQEVLHVQVTTTPVVADEGRVSGFRMAILDISERKLIEEEREELLTELAIKNAELEQFAYTVSHDLKSPLITIGGYIGALAEDLAAGDEAAMEECISRLSQAAVRMTRLLEELLELSRIGRVVGPMSDVPLADLVDESIDSLHGISAANVQFQVSDDLPVLYGDPQRLGEVVQNLIENAVKYMGDRADARVEISARCAEDEPICYIRDNGIGIDPRYQSRIFDLFDQLDTQNEGTGIGLALAKRIIEFHGGRIWVESEGCGRGSTFCFTVPRRAV